MPTNSPKELAANLQDIPPEILKTLEHALLYQAREYAGSQEDQNKLAGPEHRAFAREATAENPLMSIPIALATLAYQPYKAVVGKSRSSGGTEQVAQGFAGIGEGLSLFTSSKAAAIRELLAKL